MRSSSTEVEVVARFTAQQVGVGQDDAGAVIGQVVDNLVDWHTFLLDAHLQPEQFPFHNIV